MRKGWHCLITAAALAAGLLGPSLAMADGAKSGGASDRAAISAPQDEARLSVARRITALTSPVGLDIVDQSLRQFEPFLLARNPGKVEQAKAFLAEFQQQTAGRLPELIEAIARLLAQSLSLEDLQAVLAFSQSPAGQQFHQDQARLTSAAYQPVQDWAEEVLPQFGEIATRHGLVLPAARTLTHKAPSAAIDPAHQQATRQFLLWIQPMLMEHLERQSLQHVGWQLLVLQQGKRREIQNFVADIRAAWRLRLPDLVDRLAMQFAELHRSEDLQAILTFLQSPVGQRFLETRIALNLKGQELQQAWMKDWVQAFVDEGARRHGLVMQ